MFGVESGSYINKRHLCVGQIVKNLEAGLGRIVFGLNDLNNTKTEEKDTLRVLIYAVPNAARLQPRQNSLESITALDRV